MQIGPNTTIPAEVLDAARDGNLVFFVGAGVSVPPPSSLPGFDALAEQVGALFQKPAPLAGQPPDAYLGRLKEDGLPVHDRVEDLVVPEGSEPNDLHRLLIQLSLTGGQPRIVTTNFDHHFETTAQTLLPDPLQVYQAPALPPGDDFTGLVYLHGRAHDRPYRIVVTDEDFGAAYLVRGWATRFLRDMFRRYVTVFVGYSHKDSVMQYLARGLPPDSVRFAFDRGTAESSAWRHRRITLVPFALGEGDHDYSGLPAMLTAWKDHADLRYGDIAERTKQVVDGPPDVGDDIWFLVERFNEPQVQAYFSQYARRPEWLRWADEHDLIGELFDPNNHYSERHSKLATWFRFFAWNFPGDALQVVQRRGPSMSPTLWDHLARDVANGEWSGEPFDPATKLLWLAVLLRSPRPQFHRYDPLTMAVTRLDPVSEWPAMSLLLHDQLQPRVNLVRSFASYFKDERARQVGAEIELTGDEYFLNDLWKNKVRPHLQEHAVELAEMLAGHLRSAATLLRPFETGEPPWRAMAHVVQRLRDGDFDEHREGARLLVIAARDVVGALAASDPQRALMTGHAWFNETPLVLRRLGLYALAQSDGISPDDKVELVLANGLLDSYWLKTEVYNLLRSAAGASTAARRKLSDAVRRVHEDAGDDDTEQYEAYNMAAWLRDVMPAPETEGLFDELQALHADFAPRDEPDLEGVVRIKSSSGWVKPAPVDPHFGRLRDPEDGAVGRRRDWVAAAIESGVTDTHVETLFEHAKEDTAASVRLATELRDSDVDHPRVWIALIRGWSQASLDPDDAMAALVALRPLASQAASWEDLAEFYRQLGKSQTLDESGLLEAARQVTTLLRACESLDYPLTFTDRDWLHVSINHPGGRLAQAAVAYFYRARALDLQVPELPELRLLRDYLAVGDSDVARIGRIILFANLPLFVHSDPGWAEQELLPIMAGTDENSEQAWHGYLWLAKPDAVLFERMLPQYRDFANRVHNEPDDIRDHFTMHLAQAAFFYGANLDDHWLDEFVALFPDSVNVALARQMDRLLGALTDEQRQSVWSGFLKGYWERRNSGVPKPFSPNEAAVLTSWLDELRIVYPEAAELFLASPAPALEYGSDLWQVAESPMLAEHPNIAARVAHRIIENTTPDTMMCSQIEQMVSQLHEAGADSALLLTLCDDLAEWTCPGAIPLRQQVTGTR